VECTSNALKNFFKIPSLFYLLLETSEHFCSDIKNRNDITNTFIVVTPVSYSKSIYTPKFSEFWILEILHLYPEKLLEFCFL